MKKLSLLFSACILLGSGALLAADETKERYTRASDSMATAEELGWSGSAGAGVLLTSGNVDNINVNVDVLAKLEQARLRHNILLTAITTEAENIKTAERYVLGYKLDYKLTPRSYIYGDLRVEIDEFSGFDRQTSETVGYGYRFLDSKSDTLDLEIGAGVRQFKFNNGETDSEGVTRGALDYHHFFSEEAEFHQGILVLAGEENTSIDTITAIKAGIVGNLMLEAAIKAKYNTDPPAGSKDTDTVTTLSVVYGF